MLHPDSFLKYLEQLLPSYRSRNYLLAISGGVDSMVLLDLFRSQALSVEVAHVNYKLRGNDSDADKNLIADYCQRHHLKFHLYEVSEVDNQPENSIQNWARNLRYQFFREVQKAEGLEYLVTAHHLNDELETFLIHLSRGSGLYGLSGIPANKNNILRPFLHIAKEDIYAFAAAQDIDYREDESNKKSDYLRNKIRLEVVPQLLETNENFLKNFRRSLDYLQQNREFVQQQMASIEEQILADDGPEKIIYDKVYFHKQDDFVKFEILRKFGFEDALEIEKIFLAQTGKSFYSKNHQILINRDELIITKNNDPEEELEEIPVLQTLSNTNETQVNIKEILLQNTTLISPKNTDKAEGLWELDADKVVLPLRLRRWKTGDIIYPAGMFGKKKVAKFFKDEKLSLLDKKEIWLLIDHHDQILGVLPLRQDRRAIKTSKTANCIKVRF